MSFVTDKQTLDDLNLVGRFKKDSIINLFDRTRTRYGKHLLETMFRNPMNDAESIRSRTAELKYYTSGELKLSLNGEMADAVEFYLNASSSSSPLVCALKMLGFKLKQMFAADRNYEKIQEGMNTLAAVIDDAEPLMRALEEDASPMKAEAVAFRQRFRKRILERMKTERNRTERSLLQSIGLDRLFRVQLQKDIHELMEQLYRLDALLSVAEVARERAFGFAEVQEDAGSRMLIKGVYHPSLKHAVANDILIDHEHNVFFLTGVNMAGKSTFMKSVAITMYLAHIGFPVPAESMEFTPVNGIFTSINVPDNIALGYSHFYAEVLRVKQIAEAVKSGKRLFIIFDELFKGTNVKDAYDATLSVTEAFSRHDSCLYIISTHIVETGKELSKMCGNVTFRFFPAGLDGDRPVYTYKLEEGISEARHGMTIIRHEKVIETIRNSK